MITAVDQMIPIAKKSISQQFSDRDQLLDFFEVKLKVSKNLRIWPCSFEQHWHRIIAQQFEPSSLPQLKKL